MDEVAPEPRAKQPAETVRKLLVLDTSYTLEMVRERGLERPILSRDLDGFFAHVWSVHPFATLLTSDDWGPRCGRPERYELAPRHTVIEGKVGRFAWLRWLFPLNFLLAQADLFFRLLRLIRRERISAIRAPSPLYTGLFALMLSRAARIPLVIRVGANHDELREFTGKPVEPRFFRTRWLEKRVERFVFPRADLVAGANQNNLDFAIANAADPGRSTIFRYGNLIDPRHFVDPRERSFDPHVLGELRLNGEPFMISVARLERVAAVKHPDDIIRALAWLAAREVGVKAVMVGDGPLREDVVRLAEELGVQDRLVMTGNKDQGWLAQVLPHASVHVSPQAGRALSEAALAAVPTVAYDIDWQRELIETGVTGILVRYRDWEGMAAATKQMLEDIPAAHDLGKKLRLRAVRMLDPQMLTEHEQQTYRELFRRRIVQAQ